MSRDTMRSICPSLAFFLALAAAGVTQPALGQLSYTDLDTFLSASGSTAEAAMPASGSTTSQVVGAMTFTNDPPSTLSFGFVDGGLTALTPGNDLAISGVEDFNIDFATPITSLGFQWVDKAAADTTFTATFLSGGVGGTIVDVMNFSGPENVLLFDGFVTTQAFDRVEIREVGNDNQNEYFGQFFTGALAKSFNNPAGGNWDTAANWTDSAVPAAADYVYVSSLDGADVIGPAAATTVAGLTVDNTGPGTTGLNLQASGALTVSNEVFIGQNGSSRITVPNGGTLNVAGDTNIGDKGRLRLNTGATFNPTGATNLDGGTLEVDSISQLSGSPAFNWNSGTLEVTGASGLNVNLGGALGGNPVTIGAGKTLDVTNTLQVNASVIVNIDGGTVEAGNLTALFGTINANSGTVNIDGTFTNTGNVSLAGADVTVNTFDASVFAPSFSDGTLTIDGGSFIPFAGSNDFTLSSNLGTPTLTLENGAAMALAPAGTFTIGPGAGDNGMLNIASGSTVTSGSTNIGNISFVSDSIANVNGAGSSWNITGALNLGNGSVTNQNANRSRDQLNVDDDAEVTVSGVVTIGTTGRVNLDGGQITAGGWVRNASSIFDHTGGVLEIDGGSFSNGSSTYTLNGTDRPEIHLTNGATNVSNDTQVLNGVYRVGSGSTITGSRLDIYDGAGGNGLVVVSGAGSRWDLSFATGGALDVGITTGGEGELRIADGAVVSSPDIRVAASTGNNVGTVKVQDANSTLAITSNSVDSYIGGSASAGAGAVGLVEITAGGTMTVADDLFIGSVSTADGTVKVLGTGSSLTIGENDGPANDFLVVGNNGTGTLEVRDGGVVTTEQLFVSNDDNGMGVVTIDSTNTPGAKLEVSGQADIGDQNDGSLTVSNGGLFITSSQGNFAARIGAAGNADGAKLVVDNATWNHMGTERLAIGDFADDGTHPSPLLEIKNGGTVTAAGTVFVADQALSTGELIVDGPGSTFTGMARLAMGDNGDGVMTISGGATVATSATGFVEISAFSGGTGIATVTGPGSTLTAGDFLSIGDEGTADGMLTIDDGGVVSTTTGDITIARVASTSVGEVIVRDSILGNGLNGSTLIAGGSIYVGGSATAAGGSGSILVQQGGIVKATNTFKVWDDATATLSGNGVIEAEALDVVEQGDFVFNQGTFRFTHPTSTNLSADTLADLLASNPDPAPTLLGGQTLEIVNDLNVLAPLRLNGGTLSLGTTDKDSMDNLDWDSGTLRITDQNLVVVGGSGILGSSVIIDENQILEVPNNLVQVNPGNDLNVIRGTVSAAQMTNSGLMVVSNTSSFNSDADNNGSGLTNNGDLVLIDATIAGDVVNNGDIEIVKTAGFASDLSLLIGGSLGIDIGGLTNFDSLSVGGTANLAGVLSIDLSSGYTPNAGDSFEVLTAAALVDSGISLSGDSAGFSLLTTPTSLILQFAAAGLPGDYNNDGLVNLVDYTVWRDNLGSTAALANDNTPGVDSTDYTVWKNNFGASAQGISAITEASVPEPASLWILVACTTATTLRFARRRLRWR